MGPCRCIVSFTAPDGIVHEVQVYATTVYGAIAAAISEWEFGGIAVGKPGPMTEMTVLVHRQPVTHRLLFKQVTSWAKGAGRGPQDHLDRQDLRRLLKLDEGG